ncbi:MAG: DUF523 domain-containing protein [Geopsychrobacter sp.]|nr:DUF523 domain-containing protein [Geopsychrobacter sp.]
MKASTPLLVSACLLGINCRYDGTNNRNQQVIDFIAANGRQAIPICPEQLGGLPTPRAKTWFTSGDGQDSLYGKARMRDERGLDPQLFFIRGAEETLKIARQCGCDTAILKQRSPSCGSQQVYCEGELIDGVGITCALLQREGLKIFAEEYFQPK